MRSSMKVCAWFISLSVLLAMGGCGSASGPKFDDFPEATNEHKPRLGVYTFQAEADSKSAIPETRRGEFAADEAADMFGKTKRFEVVMRRQLMNLIRDQKKSEMFKNGVLATPGTIEGVDYLLTGSVSKLSITKEAKPLSFTQKMSGMFSKAASKKAVNVTVKCNVGMRIVDLSTGDEVVSNNSQLDRSGPAQSLGIDMMASSTKFGALPVTEEDREMVIRIALHDAIKKSLPKIDRYIQSLGDMPTTPATTPTAGTGTITGVGAAAPANAQPAQKKCPSCNAMNDPAAKICKSCGANL